MLGIVDVGGGERGIYGAGIFDWLIANDIWFDFIAGVSAGSANGAAYLGKQKGRNYLFYTEYSFRKEYMSFQNMLKTGNYLNLEYVYADLSNSNGENPLDFQQMLDSGKTLKIVATDAETGKPVYYDMHDMKQDDYGAIKGSSCVPVASRPYEWHGKKLYDGGLSDPIPVKYCMDHGCDKVVVILTRPKDYYRKPDKDARFARLIERKYPAAAAALRHRAETYNSELDYCKALEREGSVLIVAPDDIGKMGTLTKDKQEIRKMYDKGYHDAENILPFIQNK